MVIPTYNEADNLALDRRSPAGRPARASTCWSSTTTRPTAPARSPTSWRPTTPGQVAAPHREGRPRARRTCTASGSRSSRLRRDRRDGRRRLPPARAAAPAARRAGRRRPRDRLALGARRLGRQLAAPPRAALARRQPLRPAAARHRVRDATAGFRLFRRTTLEKIDLADGPVDRLRLPDRPGARTLAAGPGVREVPIEFVERVRGDSKMSGEVAAESLQRITALGPAASAAQQVRRAGEDERGR